MKTYVVTVKRVLEDIVRIEVDADSPQEARDGAAELLLSERPACWNVSPSRHAKIMKTRRVR